MDLEFKSATTGVKVLDEGSGIVQAIVSVTNVTDQVNDKILPGGYAETLTKRMPKGLRGHDWQRMVAKTLQAEELLPGDPRIDEISRKIAVAGGGGLLVRGQYNLNTQLGRDAYEDAKFFGDDMEWSVGYKVPKGRSTIVPRTGTREIKTMDLYEWSDVAFGAAPLTAGTTSVKSLDALEVKAAFVEMVAQGELSPEEIKAWSDLWIEEGCEGGLGCDLKASDINVTSALDVALERRYAHLEPACGGDCGCHDCAETKLFTFGFGAPHRIPWNEVLHPRGPGGKFAVGHGGAADTEVVKHVTKMQGEMDQMQSTWRTLARVTPPGVQGAADLTRGADVLRTASNHLTLGVDAFGAGNVHGFRNSVSRARQVLEGLDGGPVREQGNAIRQLVGNLRGLDAGLGRVVGRERRRAPQVTTQPGLAFAKGADTEDLDVLTALEGVLEAKVDRVSTPAGVRRYHAPVGTPIVGGRAVPKVPSGKGGKKKPSLGGMLGARADAMKKRQTDSQALLSGAKGKPDGPAKPEPSKAGKVDESLQSGRTLAAKHTLSPEGVKANKELNPDFPGLSKMGPPDITTSDVDEALAALAAGKNVELNQPVEVSTLLDRMQAVVNHAKDEDASARKQWADAGKAAEDYDAAQKAKTDPEHLKVWLNAGNDEADLEHVKTIPDYNLCHISVKGTNLFCAEHQNETRITMPQLAGKPKEGSEAAKILQQENAAALAAWTKDGKDPAKFIPEVEVNLANQFRDYLKEQGFTTDQTDEKASNLRASQKELVGVNVAGMLSSMANTNPDGSAKGPGRVMPPGRIYVSADNYVLDGHHRWAAATALDLADNKVGDVDMQVERVNLDIRNLLNLSVEWTTEMGIPPKGGGKGSGAESAAAAGAKEVASTAGAAGAAAKAWLELEFELEQKGLDPLACITDELRQIVAETGGDVDDSDLEWIVERVARRLEDEQGDEDYPDDDPLDDEAKAVRTVRSAAGARYYGDPIGSPIRPNVGPHPHGHTRPTRRRIPRRRAHTPVRVPAIYLPNQPGSSVTRTEVGPGGTLFPVHEYPDLDYTTIRDHLAQRGGLRKVMAEDLNFFASLLLRHLMGHGANLGSFQQSGLPTGDVDEKSLWTESLHPRGTGGQFAPKGSGSGSSDPAGTPREVKPRDDISKGIQSALLKSLTDMDEAHRRAAASFVNEAVQKANKAGGTRNSRQWQADLINTTKKKIQAWQPQASERRVAPQRSGPARPSMKAAAEDLELADYFGAMTDADWGAVLDATHGNDLVAVKLINDLVDLELKDLPDSWLGDARARHMIQWFERTDDPTVPDAELEEKVSSRALPPLEKVPGKQNWVDKSGGLPDYIDRIARHLHSERGMTVGQAIATAVNRVKKWAAGVGNVTPETRAKAAKALAEWEAKKAASRARTLAAHAARSSKKALPPDLEEKLKKALEEKRDFSADVRKEHAATGVAMPDGSYPIPDKGALKRAIQAYGRAKDQAATKRHIIKRARALGATDLLPDRWVDGKDDDLDDLDEKLLGAAAVHHVRSREGVARYNRPIGSPISALDRRKIKKWSGRLGRKVRSVDDVHALERAAQAGLDPSDVMTSLTTHPRHHPDEVVDHLLRQRTKKGLDDMGTDLGDLDLDIDDLFPGLDLKVAKHRFMGKDKANGKCAICKLGFNEGKHIGADDAGSEDAGAKKKAEDAKDDGEGDGKKKKWVPPWKKQLDELSDLDVAEMKTLLAEWEAKGDGEDDEEEESAGGDETEDEVGDEGGDDGDEEVEYEEVEEIVYEDGAVEGDDDLEETVEYEEIEVDAEAPDDTLDAADSAGDPGALEPSPDAGDGHQEAAAAAHGESKSNPGGKNQYGGPYSGGSGGGERTAAQGTEVWNGVTVHQGPGEPLAWDPITKKPIAKKPAPKRKVIVKKRIVRKKVTGTAMPKPQLTGQRAPSLKDDASDELEGKAGRMLSGANATAIQSALDQLVSVLARAGLCEDKGKEGKSATFDDLLQARDNVREFAAEDEGTEEKAQVLELDEHGEATIVIGSGRRDAEGHALDDVLDDDTLDALDDDTLDDGMVYLPLEDLMAAADLRLTSPL